MTSRSLQLVRVEGSPFARGEQVGRSCGDLIARYPEILLSQINDGPEGLHGQVPVGYTSKERVSIDELRRRAISALPALRKRVPELVVEMEGIAHGARLPFEDVLIVNLRGELVRDPATIEPACTAFAVASGATATGETLVGQNLDGEPRLCDLLVVAHVIPDDGGQVIMLTFAGLVGYHGLGERIGVAATAGSVGAWAAGLPHYPFKRLLLQQRTIEDAIRLADCYPFSSSGNYVAADADGAILGLEVVPEAAPARLAPDDDIVLHTNHFLTPAFAQRDALLAQFPDSPRRLTEARTMLHDSHGRITFDVLVDVLRSHTCGAASICRHDELETIGSFIAEPAAGSLTVAVGSPCLTEYERFELA